MYICPAVFFVASHMYQRTMECEDRRVEPDPHNHVPL